MIDRAKITWQPKTSLRPGTSMSSLPTRSHCEPVPVGRSLGGRHRLTRRPRSDPRELQESANPCLTPFLRPENFESWAGFARHRGHRAASAHPAGNPASCVSQRPSGQFSLGPNRHRAAAAARQSRACGKILISKPRCRTRRSSGRELFIREPMADVRVWFRRYLGQQFHSGQARILVNEGEAWGSLASSTLRYHYFYEEHPGSFPDHILLCSSDRADNTCLQSQSASSTADNQ